MRSIFRLNLRERRCEGLGRAISRSFVRARHRSLVLETLVADVVSQALLRLAIPVGRWSTWNRFRRGRIRSIWGVTPILTLRTQARCDRLLGIEGESVVLSEYHIMRDFDHNLSALARQVHARNSGLYQPFCRLLLAWALIRFDVFNYFADRGFLPPEDRFGIHWTELAALRAAGKRLYVYAYGADVRTRGRTLDSGRWNLCSVCPEPGKFCICDDDRGTSNIRATAAAATAMIAMADMPRYVPGCWQFDYWPIDINSLSWEPLNKTGPLTVAHAPNTAWTKGSQYLVEAIERLKAEGATIELIRVQGVPNEEVLRLFTRATIVADQFICGAFGYTALEAMAIGRPVLCFLREPENVAGGTECPIINTSPDEIYDRLRWCLANRDRLVEIGNEGRRYVERYHSLVAVAQRLASLYGRTGEFPPVVAAAIRARASALDLSPKSFSPSIRGVAET
jgi:hypothetical protein